MQKPDKILIIRLSSIGDIILSYPLIMELHNKYPDCSVDYLVGQAYREVLQPVDHLLDKIYSFDKSKGWDEIKEFRKVIKERDYDWIVDIHNKFRSNLLARLTGAKVYRMNKHRMRRALFVKMGLDVYPQIPVYKKYLNTLPIDLEVTYDWYLKNCGESRIIEKVGRKIPEINTPKPTVIIFPGTRHFTKQWPLSYYLELIVRIVAETNCNVILAGDQNDAEMLADMDFTSDNISNSCGKLSLLETLCLVSQCDIAISNDSGPMHMAAAFHKPQIAIFGNTVPTFGFAPLNDRAVLIQNQDLKCRPCSHIGFEMCPRKHFKCMLDIDVDQVYGEFKKLLQKY